MMFKKMKKCCWHWDLFNKASRSWTQCKQKLSDRTDQPHPTTANKIVSKILLDPYLTKCKWGTPYTEDFNAICIQKSLSQNGILLFVGHSITNMLDITVNLSEYQQVMAHEPWQAMGYNYPGGTYASETDVSESFISDHLSSQHSGASTSFGYWDNRDSSQINNSEFNGDVCVALKWPLGPSISTLRVIIQGPDLSSGAGKYLALRWVNWVRVSSESNTLSSHLLKNKYTPCYWAWFLSLFIQCIIT